MSNLSYVRPQAVELLQRLREPRRFLQIITGARQVGETTLITQVAEQSELDHRFASPDEPTLRGPEWIAQQWDAARLMAGHAKDEGARLILDEVQKAPNWAEAVKRLWDEDTRSRRRLRVVLSGSAQILIGRGLTESLAGRFEFLHLPHWSFPEMQDAFGWSLERFLFYGAYPGAVPLARQPVRWSRYIRDSLIEPMISRDVLLLSRVDKLALLRRLFELGCVPSDAVGAVVGAVGVLARGMAAACVEPAAGLVTPALLTLAVRRMALRGEALFVIEVTAMRVDLLPAWINDIDGAAAPATWVYDVQLEGPRGVTERRRLPAAAVVHVRWPGSSAHGLCRFPPAWPMSAASSPAKSRLPWVCPSS